MSETQRMAALLGCLEVRIKVKFDSYCLKVFGNSHVLIPVFSDAWIQLLHRDVLATYSRLNFLDYAWLLATSTQ